MQDIDLLIRDKYDGDASQVTADDRNRLADGEPLAYVIGWVPFLGLKVHLDGHPLIPRPETEWWTEELIRRIGDTSASVLDLCAGSGAIGLAILFHCPNARVTFSDVHPEYADLIRKNIEKNGLNAARADIRTGDLFDSVEDMQFDIIATNPPYIPSERELDASVMKFEPHDALFAGTEGLEFIRYIAREAKHYTKELWMECDVSNASDTWRLLVKGGSLRTTIRTDQYGRERLVLAYY